MDLIYLGFGIIIGTIIGSLGILLFQKIKKNQIENRQDSDVFDEIKSIKKEVETYNTTAHKDRGAVTQILTDMRNAEKEVGDAAREIKKMNDADAIEYITKLKGLGVWSAEMFLMFNLNRPDIFPVKDIGLLRAISKNYKVSYPPSKEIPYKPGFTIALIH